MADLPFVQIVVELPDGTVEQTGRLVRVGDRLIPSSIEVRLDGVDGEPGRAMTIEVVDGVPQCRDLRITSVDGGREVRSKDLAALDLRVAVEEFLAPFVHRVLRDEGTHIAATIETGDAAHNASVRAIQQARKTRGPRRVDEPFRAEVARRYLDGARVEDLAAIYGVKARRVNDYLKAAEDDGYLAPPAKPGTRRGPGPRLDGKD